MNGLGWVVGLSPIVTRGNLKLQEECTTWGSFLSIQIRIWASLGKKNTENSERLGR